MLSAIMLSVVILSAIMLNVVKVNVVLPWPGKNTLVYLSKAMAAQFTNDYIPQTKLKTIDIFKFISYFAKISNEKEMILMIFLFREVACHQIILPQRI
jgi:hypothetical protein